MTTYTVYRNSYYTTEEGHAGYEFFATKGEAQRAFQGMKNEKSTEDDDGLGISACAEPVEFQPTKAGIIVLLNRVAGHNDNG